MRWSEGARSPADFVLDGGAVSLWCIPVRHTPPPGYADLLTDSEQARAERYRRPADRARFLTGRVALRTLLGDAMGTHPATVPLATDDRGKPYLAHGAAFAFSVAHAGNWVVIGLTRGPDVGVDVEQVNDFPDLSALAGRILSARELAVWRTLAPAERTDALFAWWTCKEALLKATGDGLTTDPTTIAIDLLPVPRVADSDDGRWRGADWHLEAFPVDAAHVGAVAVRAVRAPAHGGTGRNALTIAV